MAQGFVALEAARAAARGATIDEVTAVAERMTGEVSLLAMLDTLTYLARSGRVPRVAAWAAGMLGVRPIVRFGAGDIRLAGRAHSRARALRALADQFVAAVGGRETHLAVHHANAPGDAHELLERIGARVPLAEAHVSEFTQVMGVHTGPGLAGLAFWTES
jgi:DegV family protein with EDD domain